MPDLPDDVIEHLRSVFTACNARTSEKLSMNPNAPEESLDLTWIEHVSRYSAPVTLPSEWLVKVETHYLGGMRHFRRWEIGDIGVLVNLRLGADGRRSKVALLQSKRLYPDGTPFREEAIVDYEIGFARLADPEDKAISLGFATVFRFSDESVYGQIRGGSDQVAAIEDYEAGAAEGLLPALQPRVGPVRAADPARRLCRAAGRAEDRRADHACAGGAVCARHDQQLGGASPLWRLMAPTASQGQLRRREAAWGGKEAGGEIATLEEHMARRGRRRSWRARVEGGAVRASLHHKAKPDAIKGPFRKRGGCAMKVVGLTLGGLRGCPWMPGRAWRDRRVGWDGGAREGAARRGEVSRGRIARRAARVPSWWKSSRTGPKRGP